MVIRERTRYPLPAEEIWPYLIRADLFVQWNPRIRKIHAKGDFAVGDEFWTEYVLSRSATVCSSTVEVVEPFRRLAFLHTRCQTETALTELRVRESFELVSRRRTTELRHRIDIRGHGLNIFVSALMWFLTTFGKTVEADRLERLLAERVKAQLGQMLK